MDRSEPKPETAPKNLPSGIKEAKKSGIFAEIDQNTLPWLDQKTKTELTLVTLASGEKFYLGSAIRGKALTDAASSLNPHYQNLTDSLLYAHLPEFVINEYSPTVKQVANGRTDKPTYYCGNKGGQRVYFVRQPNINNSPCIIRVAVCDKNKQEDVLSVLTTKSRKYIANSSKL